MRHKLQVKGRVMVFARITTAFVVGCLGLFGCAAPRGGENAAPDEGRGLTTDAGRLEVREEQYAGGAIRRRTEGRVDGNDTFVPHGLQTNFAEDGHKLSEMTHVDGVKHGPCTAWYRDGEVRSQGRYTEGREDGQWIVWYPDGRKAQELNFVRGAWHGMYREWHQNGQLKIEVEFVKGLKQGPETIWDDQGKIARQTEYVDGVAQP